MALVTLELVTPDLLATLDLDTGVALVTLNTSFSPVLACQHTPPCGMAAMMPV